MYALVSQIPKCCRMAALLHWSRLMTMMPTRSITTSYKYGRFFIRLVADLPDRLLARPSPGNQCTASHTAVLEAWLAEWGVHSWCIFRRFRRLCVQAPHGPE